MPLQLYLGYYKKVNILYKKKSLSVFLIIEDYQYRDWLKFDLI